MLSAGSCHTASVFCSPPSGCHYLIFLFPQTWPEPALGYSAITDNEWFAGKWSASQKPLSIAYKELFPVVISAALWGHQFATKRVEVCSDNMAVVSVLRSGTLKDPNKMVLLCHLSLVAAPHSFTFMASHTAGRDNSIADAHFDFQCFHHLAPHAATVATSIPALLLDQLPVILKQNASSTYPMVLPLLLVKSMALPNANF